MHEDEDESWDEREDGDVYAAAAQKPVQKMAAQKPV
jgi:hypothetical protein